MSKFDYLAYARKLITAGDLDNDEVREGLVTVATMCSHQAQMHEINKLISPGGEKLLITVPDNAASDEFLQAMLTIFEEVGIKPYEISTEEGKEVLHEMIGADPVYLAEPPEAREANG